MEEQHKLTKHSLFMVFKLLLIILIMPSFFSCLSRADDASNEIRILNDTNDTLIFYVTKKYISNIPGSERHFYPNNYTVITRATHVSGFDMIKDDWGDAKDTIEIYKHDTLLVKWGGPLRNLHDSVHSFYNENSWVIECGGRKNKYVIATFTITEDDFMRDD